MAALTADRNTPRRDGFGHDFFYELSQATNTTIYKGALVVRSATGYATPATAATGLVALGIADVHSANTGADGAVKVKIRPGVYRFGNSGSSDAITIAEIGAAAYGVDDQTVAKTNGSASRSAIGKIIDVDGAGVWVGVGPAFW